jgi:hypothetical protein
MSLVYKSGAPEIDTSKVKIEIPGNESAKPDDILKDLQKGGPAEKKDEPAPADGKAQSEEDKAAAELEKALKGGK